MTDLAPRHAFTDLSVELQTLVKDVEGFVAESLSRNTLRAYTADWRDFVGWCRDSGLHALPATSATVALYAAAMVRRDLKAGTISRRMSALKHFHRWAGFPESPTNAVEVETVMRGIRRSLGTAQRGKAPTSTAMLRRMLSSCPSTLIGLRDSAVLLVGFAGAFRRSALVALDAQDVEFREEGLVVLIKRDKTDQEGQGRVIGIPYGSNPDTCPVRVLRRWLCDAAITEGPVFRSFSPHGDIQSRRLGAEDVARIVKKTCAAAGIDPKDFAGHSLRAGFVTTAAEAGEQERVIAEQTGHQSMAVLRTYIRKGSLFRNNPAAKLGL